MVYKASMQLWLIRHGECEDAARSDEERLLTAEGAAAAQNMATHLANLEARPAVLFSSPFQRALQTATFFSEAWGREVQTAAWLDPMAEPSQMLSRLKERPETEIALVGHMPNLGMLLSVLLWGLPPREVLISRGAVAWLEAQAWEPSAAKLHWLLSPKEIP